MAPLRPKFLALDTCDLADWCDDCASSDSQRNARAQVFGERLRRINFVPLVTIHHLHELFSIESEKRLIERFRFLESLPCIGWARDATGGGVGSIADIMAFEALVSLQFPHLDSLGVRDNVKPILIEIGTGKAVAAWLRPFWNQFIVECRRQSYRAKEISSIARMQFSDDRKRPIADLLKGRIRDPIDLALKLSAGEQDFIENIVSAGDPKIASPQSSAKSFFDSVVAIGYPLPNTVKDLLERIFAPAGISLDDIDEQMTLAEILDLAEFRMKLLAALGESTISLTKLATISPRQIPSWIIESRIRAIATSPRSFGSDLTDSHLACLTAYADITTVDKRTKEKLRQATSKCAELSALVGSAQRKKYWEICLEHLFQSGRANA